METFCLVPFDLGTEPFTFFKLAIPNQDSNLVIVMNLYEFDEPKHIFRFFVCYSLLDRDQDPVILMYVSGPR